jgi:hypothetical protein
MSPSRKYNKQRETSIQIQQGIWNIFEEIEPRLTVRQVYYALTVKGILPKNEAGYRQTIYQLKMMREAGIIPYNWIADNTRFYIKPTSDSSLSSALDRMQKAYRRDFWATQESYVEIWVEKDALAGVISPITTKFDVPLYVVRGYGSITVLHDAAEFIKSIGKPAFIYHFGDYDPSGVDAAYKVREGLLKHGADITFERIAITPAQSSSYDLPQRPTKKTDPRSKQWGDKPSVELDALPAPVLRKLVKDCIEKHINQDEWAIMQMVEQAERNTLATIQQNLALERNSQFGK